nr:uncharacterized protein LOC131276890 [Dasypus novemcinctus]
MNPFEEDGDRDEALPRAYRECCHMASSDFFWHFLQEPLDRTRGVDVQMVLEKEKEEVFPRQCRWKCGLNSEKTVDLPDIDGDFPGPPPFLSTGDEPGQLYEETIKAGETIVSRPKSGDSPWASDFADSQSINELFNIRNISPGECPTILNLMGEQDVGKSPLKVYPDSEPKLQLEGEPLSQSPPGCATEGFPNSPSLSSEDYEPCFPNVCRGNMTNSQVPYIHLEERGSNLGLQEQRDSKVKISWMVEDASLNLNTEKEDPKDFPLERYPERESGSGSSLGIEMMDDPSQDMGSTESVMPQLLPQKGQGHQESKHQKRDCPRFTFTVPRTNNQGTALRFQWCVAASHLPLSYQVTQTSIGRSPSYSGCLKNGSSPSSSLTLEAILAYQDRSLKGITLLMLLCQAAK